MKQYFRYTAGRLETPADRPLIAKVSGRLSGARSFSFKDLIVSLTVQRQFPGTRKEPLMSQVITNRVRTSRRALLKGMTAAGARITAGAAAAGFDVQFDGNGLCGDAGTVQREAHRNPLCVVVQRQRHSRALLDSLPKKAPITK